VGHSEIGTEVGSRAWRQLYRAVVPSRLFSGRTKWHQRIWELVKLPYHFAFSLTIPIYDTEEDDEEGSGDSTDDGRDARDASQHHDEVKNWSQYLHVIQVSRNTSTFSASVTLRRNKLTLDYI
jgi:hypothetical protein